jgi:hypothetical protein
VGREHIHMKMEQNMSESGKMINKMGTVFSSGLMDKFTKENIRMEQKLEREF